MTYREFMDTNTYRDCDVIYFINEDGVELDDLPEEDYIDAEVLKVNKSECTGIIEVVLKGA